MITFAQWLRQAVARLSGSESPRRDAEILLGYVTDRTRTYILAFDETTLTAAQEARLEALLERRQRGEPIAYLLGQREFWSLPLFVSPATLIPRADTECLVEQALALLPSEGGRILDLGTGSGAIALALASERPDCHITAVDSQPDAVALAVRNAAHLAIANVSVQQSDWFGALTGQQFSLIVSNPPYIDAADPHLLQGDVRFEPRTALVSGENGLADLAYIIRQGRRFLMSGGFMLLEHGWQQGEAVRGLFCEAGYVEVATRRDYGGNERLTFGRFIAKDRVEK